MSTLCQARFLLRLGGCIPRTTRRSRRPAGSHRRIRILQNIPIRTELGRRVRQAFVADRRPEFQIVPNSVLVSLDYSQIELRLMAHMSQEPFLVEAFSAGEDIHRATACLVYGVPIERRSRPISAALPRPSTSDCSMACRRGGFPAIRA